MRQVVRHETNVRTLYLTGCYTVSAGGPSSARVFNKISWPRPCENYFLCRSSGGLILGGGQAGGWVRRRRAERDLTCFETIDRQWSDGSNHHYQKIARRLAQLHGYFGRKGLSKCENSQVDSPTSSDGKSTENITNEKELFPRSADRSDEDNNNPNNRSNGYYAFPAAHHRNFKGLLGE